MGTVSPVSTPFNLVVSEGKGSVPKSCFKSAKNRSASSLLGKRSSLHKDQYAGKKSYGFTAIWTQIFFQTKMYKNRSSARGSHQNSLKSCLMTLRDVFKDMIGGFFIVKSHMGTRLEWKILLRSKNFQFLFRSKLNKSPKIYWSKLDITYLGRMCFSS